MTNFISMEPKIVVSCPTCGQRMRIPKHKHIRFSCSNCFVRLEADNGVVFTAIEVVKPIESAPYKPLRIVNRRKFRKHTLIATIGISLLVLLYLYLDPSREHNRKYKIGNDFITHLKNNEFGSAKELATSRTGFIINLICEPIYHLGDSVSLSEYSQVINSLEVEKPTFAFLNGNAQFNIVGKDQNGKTIRIPYLVFFNDTKGYIDIDGSAIFGQSLIKSTFWTNTF